MTARLLCEKGPKKSPEARGSCLEATLKKYNPVGIGAQEKNPQNLKPIVFRQG